MLRDMAWYPSAQELPDVLEITMVFWLQSPWPRFMAGRNVAMFGSHAPGDVNFREDLMRSVIGDWEVEMGESKANFKVIYANTCDEPVNGLMNVLLTEDGQHDQHAHIGDG